MRTKILFAPNTPAWGASFWRAQLRPLMADDLAGDERRDMDGRQ